MTATDTDTERAYDGDRLSAVDLFSDRTTVACRCFETGQFIPVDAPSSDAAIHVRSGTGLVRDGDAERHVEPRDVVVVEAHTGPGITTDPEHEPARNGLRRTACDTHDL